MFNQLSNQLVQAFEGLTGRGRITPQHTEEIYGAIRTALLSADVHFDVVKRFLERVQSQVVGQKILQSVSPQQQFIKIVHDELARLLGGETRSLKFPGDPTIVFMVGLQGVGKTTTSAKLACHVRQKFQKQVGLVPCDLSRPAAIEQLQILGRENNIETFNGIRAGSTPRQVYKEAVAWAKKQALEVLIVDTAGRLQVDAALMEELSDLTRQQSPHEVFLVVDAMLGQQSVSVAEGFCAHLSLTGLVLTKMDGDARGGAALSLREVTGVPILFSGTGEKIASLEAFHPDRLASRILDQGDMLTLVEEAEQAFGEEDEQMAASFMERIQAGQFGFDDFLTQARNLRKLGSMDRIMKMMPGMNRMMTQMQKVAPPEKEIKCMENIIFSMTLQERANRFPLNGSRRLRIAKGSGVRIAEVNKMLRRFEQMKRLFTMFASGQAGALPGMPQGLSDMMQKILMK